LNVAAAIVGSQIDHIVVTAPHLATGADLVRRSIGATPQTGGEHARIGTHNLVFKLGDSLYLEVIAPNPKGPAPGRPRWFELDDVKPDTPPRLAGWVARTDDIRSTLAASSEPLGEIVAMSRGELQWLITIPRDGRLPLGGIGPALIEWLTPGHPAARMVETGCTLARLEAFHPEPSRISALLESLSFEGPISVSPVPAGGRPYLVAHIQTPNGPRTI
jgi:hypothetical protein